VTIINGDALLKNKYIVDLRYNYGISNIADDVVNMHKRGFMLTAGMLFK
jgi:hypothetical protein